jgi:MarR-like DNA-binding transcriptional regulator SgrR of sgrS sRNA
VAKRNRLSGGETVREAQAKQLVSLIDSGVPQAEAEQQVGVTLNYLRGRGVLPKAVRGLLERMEEAQMVDRANQEALGRARLVELAVQDEDLKVSLGAAKELAGTAGPKVQNNTQVNIGQLTPEVMKALVSLGLAKNEVKEITDGKD